MPAPRCRPTRYRLPLTLLGRGPDSDSSLSLFPYDNPYTVDRESPLPYVLYSPAGRGVADVVDATGTGSISGGKLHISGPDSGAGEDVVAYWIRGGAEYSTERAMIVSGLVWGDMGGFQYAGIGFWPWDADYATTSTPPIGVLLDSDYALKVSTPGGLLAVTGVVAEAKDLMVVPLIEGQAWLLYERGDEENEWKLLWANLGPIA